MVVSLKKPRALTIFVQISTVMLIFCLVGNAIGSCVRYGHSCWGAHGKRSDIPTMSILSAKILLNGSPQNGNGMPDVYKILGGSRMRQANYDYSYTNGDVDENHEDLYVGHSGDPWSASSTRIYNKDIHVRVISSNNVTVNNRTKFQSATGRRITTGHARFKRGVIHLYNMVVCATGCNPLAYKGYGCYCGFLGSGYVIDGIDQCCKMHDWCYDATECLMFSEYFVPYYWRCYRGYKPICAIEHGNWGGSGSCAQRLCECDRSLAECLRRYPCPTTKAVCTSSPWRLVQNLFMII